GKGPACGPDLFRAGLRAAKRRRCTRAGDKDARRKRNSRQRDDCPPNHRRAPPWPFPCSDRFRRSTSPCHLFDKLVNGPGEDPSCSTERPSRAVVDSLWTVGLLGTAVSLLSVTKCSGAPIPASLVRGSTRRGSSSVPCGPPPNGGKISRKISHTKRVFALRPYHPSARRAYQPAAVP